MIRSVVLALRAPLLLLIIALTGGCRNSTRVSEKPDQAGAYQSLGTRRMAARLEEIAANIDPEKHRFASREKATLLRSQLEQSTNEMQQLSLRPQLAMELMYAGDTEAALVEFKKHEQLCRKVAPMVWKRQKQQILMQQAAAYLRLGEQQNCINNHTADSCLLPIKGTGVHRLPYGSREAIKILQGVLNDSPDDLAARWLLNIAAMTLGEYPQKVPAKWLIPPKAFKAEYDIKRFYDVSQKVGLDLNGLSGGSIMEDFDGDGNLDLMMSSIGMRDQLRFFHNNGDGSFTERTREAH